ncbi:MAG: GerW family sporulation protein [Lachnospiraceae bacterium]|nr:GerW family sporulation protein [Lachnospiraceae bacterium]
MAKSSENVSEIAKSLYEGMDTYLTTKTVVGEPITINDTVILPLVNVSFGLGAGSLTGKSDNGMGGLGGKMTPSAVLIIKDGSTRLMNIATYSGLDKLLDLLPDFVDKFKTEKEAKKNAEAVNASPEQREAARNALSEKIDKSVNS